MILYKVLLQKGYVIVNDKSKTISDIFSLVIVLIYIISNDELIDGYLKKLIIPCSSFTDAYEKILKYF